jgi:hypothetical protein
MKPQKYRCFGENYFTILRNSYLKDEGGMIVQNIDTDLSGNTALPHGRQIPVQTKEFSFTKN